MALVAVLVVPWVVLTLMRAPAPEPTLIAVPVGNKDLSAAVAPNFAAAKYFAIVDLRTQQIDFVENGSGRPGETLGIGAAHRLLDRGVGAVIARHIGVPARNALYSRGVRVFGTSGTSAMAALQLLSVGSLQEFAGPPISPSNPGQVAGYPGPAVPGMPGAPASPSPIEQGPTAGVAVAQSPASQPGQPYPSYGQGYGMSGGPAATIIEPLLGVQVTTAPAGGVAVLGVKAGSRAERGGIAVGDVIVELGQIQVRNVQQFRHLASRAPTTDSIALLVARNGAFIQQWAPP